MNLYEIRMRHYSPKDSEEGIICFLLTESDEKVYEWIRSEPEINEYESLHNSWMYHDNPEYEDEGYKEGFKERIIKCQGDMYDDESEVYDLYHGATQYGWGLIKENISEEAVLTIKECGIKVFTC